MKTSQSSWRDIHRVADASRPSVERVLLRLLERLRRQSTRQQIAQLLAQGRVDLIDWDAFRDALVDELRPQLAMIAKTAALRLLPSFRRSFPESRKASETYADTSFWVAMEFRLRNLDAEEFLLGDDFMPDIVDASREGIRRAILEGFRSGRHPYDMAQTISDTIGLTGAQAESIFRLEEQMRSVNASRALIESSVSRASDKALRHRANAIARTETIRAANTGQQVLWARAMDAGLLDARAQRVWITTPDDRLCPRCQALDGAKVGLNAAFSGTTLIPPLHVMCRCTVGLDFSTVFPAELLPPRGLLEAQVHNDVS